jgi:hypothetical protein
MNSTAEEIIQIYHKFQKRARIIKNKKNGAYNFLFNDLPLHDVKNAFYQELQEFQNNCNVLNIPTHHVSNRTVFEKYFSNTPPFSSGKKKCEFPDAFVLEAIHSWCNRLKKKIYLDLVAKLTF